MKSGDSRFPGAIGWLWRERGPLLCKHNRLHFLLGQKKGRGSECEQCFMLFLRQNTDHGGGRGRSRTWRNGGGRGRALSLSAAPPLPVWGGSPLLDAHWSHSRLRGASALARSGSLNRQLKKENWEVRCMHAHIPLLIITVETLPPPHPRTHTQPVRQEIVLLGTNKHFLCVLGPIHRERPIKIQCFVHSIITTIIQGTLLLIC